MCIKILIFFAAISLSCSLLWSVMLICLVLNICFLIFMQCCCCFYDVSDVLISSHIVYFNYFFASCTFLLNQLVFLILFSDCFLLWSYVLSREIAFRIDHY